MAVEVVMPRMGLNMEEGTVAAWHKQVGEAVESGEVLLDIETDKVTTEIEAQADGTLGKILVEVGETVPIGTPIAYILEKGEDPSVLENLEVRKPSTDVPVQATISAPAAQKAKETTVSKPAKVRATPSARRVARELGIDLQDIAADGHQGRISEEDVRRYWEEQKGKEEEKPKATPVAARMAASMGINLRDLKGSGQGGLIRKEDVIEAASVTSQEGDLIEIHGPRKVMAERMTYSFTTAPHFYLTAQVDVSALVELRKGLLPKIEASTGKRLTYTDLLLFFLAKALQEFPAVNTAWEDDKIRLYHHINLGVAVDTENGLIVPVIHHAEALSLDEIVQWRAELVDKARNGKLALEDLENGTFTLTNLGTFRVDLFNAVLNPPQAAILAVGRIHDAIIPVNGSPAIRSVLGLSLTCDHRVVDGALGARFLTRFVEMLEEPVAHML